MSPLFSFTSLTLFLFASFALAGAGPQPGTKAYNKLPSCGCSEGRPQPAGLKNSQPAIPLLKIRGLNLDDEQGMLSVMNFPRAMTCRPSIACA